VTGNILDSEGKALSETVEIFMRDPVLCVQDLFNNVAFRDVIAYTPERVFCNADGTNRRYDEMWTANWWWDMQVRTLSLLQTSGS
jgi:hypothetical protein